MGNGSLKVDDAYKGYMGGPNEKEAAVLSHKPIRVLRLSTSNPVASRKLDTRSLHQKLAAAKDSEVRGKPLQLRRTYHRRRTLRKTNTARKATRNHHGKYVIRGTVSMQPHHSAV